MVDGWWRVGVRKGKRGWSCQMKKAADILKSGVVAVVKGKGALKKRRRDEERMLKGVDEGGFQRGSTTRVWGPEAKKKKRRMGKGLTFTLLLLKDSDAARLCFQHFMDLFLSLECLGCADHCSSAPPSSGRRR